jgi:porin
MFPMKSIRIASVCLLISVVSDHASAELRQPLSIDARQAASDDVEWTLSDGSAHVDLCNCDSSAMDCGSGVGCGSAVASTSFFARPRLLGDAFGAKSWLAEHGVITDFILGNYYQGVASGGNEQTDAYGGKVDMIFMFQGEKFGLNKGFNIAMHAETRFGQDISSEAGSLTLPNAPMLWPLPGGYHGTNITGLMLTQSFFDGKADAVFGKLNVLDVVDILLPEVAGGREGFLNVNGLVSALPWLRYVNLSVWGGGAWTNKPQGVGSAILFFGTESVTTNWDFSESFEDGVGLLAMHRHFYEIGGKQGYIMGLVGGSTKEYVSNEPSDWLEIPGVGPASGAQKEPWTVAAYVSQDIWQDPRNKTRRMNFTIGGSVADDNPSFSNWNALARMEAFGLLPSRPGDRMGVSGWYNGLANDFVDLAAIEGVTVRDNWGVELYYNREITPWFHLTPDLQVLQNSNAGTDTSLVLGMRGIIDL